MFPGTEVEHLENADRRNYRVSFEKIRDQLGFEASRDLGYGIGELKRAFEDKEIVDYTNARYHNQKFLKMSGTPSYKEELDAHLMAAFAAAPKGNHVALAREGAHIAVHVSPLPNGPLIRMRARRFESYGSPIADHTL